MSVFSRTAFEPLVGQEEAVELLVQAVLRERVAPAYLFSGAPGIGRGLAARCFIELLFSGAGSVRRKQLGNHPDLLWVEPTYQHQGKLLTAQEAIAAGLKRKSPPQVRLEQIRQIGEFLGRPPLEASRKVVTIAQAETMNEAAANGLLKTLEEPGRATLILIAPSPESLLPTLVSRCQRIPFSRLRTEQMSQILQRLGYDEIVNTPSILAMAQGSVGVAIACWQQLQDIPAEILDRATRRPSTMREALELAKEIDRALDTEAQLWLIDYLQQNYWLQANPSGSTAPSYLHALESARRYLLSYAQPRLVWEVTLMTTIA